MDSNRENATKSVNASAHGDLESAPRPWIQNFIGLFLLADLIFVGVYQMVAPLYPVPGASNLTFLQRMVSAFLVYSFQFLLSFGIGIIVSMVIDFLGGRRGKAYQRDRWMHALVIGLFPAALLLVGAWKASHL